MNPRPSPTTARRKTSRRVAALGSASLAASLLVAPFAAAAASTAAAAAPLRAEAATECAVTKAQLDWGVKESFRSYISGTIANGSWETSGGAEYETPEFFWTDVAGGVSSGLDAGTLSFAGGVHFSGHDGALSMDLANPSIEFADNGAAYLLLDFGATDQGETETPESSQLRAAKVELDGALETSGDALTITQASTVLTSEGAEAFNGGYGSYAAGDEMDPITLTASFSGCELGAVAAKPQEPAGETEETEKTAEAPVAAPAQEIPWAPIIIGGVAILVIGVTAGMLIAGRGKGKQGAPPPSEQ